MGHVLFKPHHWLMSRQFTYTYKLPTLPSSFLAPGERACVSLVYGRGEGRERERERGREGERGREREGEREKEGGREGGRERERDRERKERRDRGREINERKCHLWRVGVFPNCV